MTFHIWGILMNNFFDLNIEQVLEHWGLEHAVREIIANALDEQLLTKSKNIEIFKDNLGHWHIRDFGRGLEYVHFTQNENQEKLVSPNLIGKFGVGLKDALAVFNRHGIKVNIQSKYAWVSLKMAQKSGFNLDTLHAVFEEPMNEDFIGTEFILIGITDDAIQKAKDMFLRFSNAPLLEKTRFGEVYKATGSGKIYVNGVQVAEEDNFMFSYNITNINAQIKKALNRERSNVGRTAYSDSIKKILTKCESKDVLMCLMNDLSNIMLGTQKDESSWIDVSTYVAKKLNEESNIVFLTPYERASLTNEQVEILEESGKDIFLITDILKEKLGDTVTTFNEIIEDYRESFQFKFIDYRELTEKEEISLRQKNLFLNF